MSFFGEYLVKKGLVTEEVLVKALVEQSSWSPQPQQVAFEYKLLTPSQMLAVFQEQFKNKGTFIEAAKRLGLWKDSFDLEIESRSLLERVPLGQILVKLGALTQEQSTQALDDFLAQGNVPKPKE